MAKTKKTKNNNNSKEKTSGKIESHTDSKGRTFYYDLNQVPYYLDLDYKPYYFDDNGSPVLYEDGVLDTGNFVDKVNFKPDSNEDEDVINELQGILESKNPAKAARKAAKKIDKEEKLQKKKDKKSKKTSGKKSKNKKTKNADEKQNDDQEFLDDSNLDNQNYMNYNDEPDVSEEYYDDSEGIDNYSENYNYNVKPAIKPRPNSNRYYDNNLSRNRRNLDNNQYTNVNKFSSRNPNFNNQYYNNGTFYGNENFFKGSYRNNQGNKYFGRNNNNYSRSLPYVPTRYSINPFLAKYGKNASMEQIIYAKEWVNSIERKAIADVDEKYRYIYRNFIFKVHIP